MAIGFARAEFVKRSEGKTAVGKAAYNARERVAFEGNCVLAPRVFDFSFREAPSYHEILLPQGVHENFCISEVLWNAVEAKEVKVNSQVAQDLVLALPDDQALTMEDKIELAKSFVEKNLIEKGFAAQIDIHPPERKIFFTQNCEALGIKEGASGIVVKKRESAFEVKLQGDGKSGKTIYFNSKQFKGFQIKEHNWHAHILATTRRFKESGMELEDRKPRDLLPQVRKGRVVAGPDWGKLWGEHQNSYFKARGMALRVDSNSLVPQEHLGPVRMRGRAFDLLAEHDRRVELNKEITKSPKKILEQLTSRQSVFSKEDVDRFFDKHVPVEVGEVVKEAFWMQKEVVSLLDGPTQGLTGKFSADWVVEEEKSILRVADKLSQLKAFSVKTKHAQGFVLEGLSPEQKEAHKNIIKGQRLSCIQGYAGTGKSYLLASLRDSYLASGYKIRGLGPDNATAKVLKEKGLDNSENVYKFLFALKNDKRDIRKGREVWVCDEAGKLGNGPLFELLRQAQKHNVQVILSGDSKQLPSVERGGMFRVFAMRYGAQALENIQRQEGPEQREITQELATSKFYSAINKLDAVGGFRWSETRSGSVEDLMKGWAVDTSQHPEQKTIMMAHTNAEVRVLNEMARIIRKERGEINQEELSCQTSLGRVFLSKGDLVEFRKNDKLLGVTNGLSGTVLDAKENKLTVCVEVDKKNTRLVSFNPQEYNAFQLGYATSYFRSQGQTVDKVHVLHSSHINKELFYVALTRHTKEARYYLSKEDVGGLQELKKLATRTNDKTNTLAFTTKEELVREQLEENKEAHIKKLKQSSFVWDRIKGFGLSAVSGLKTQSVKARQYVEDRKTNKSFYDFKIDELNLKSVVSEILSSSKSIELYEDKKAAIPSEVLFKNMESKVLLTEDDASLGGAKKTFSNQKFVFGKYLSQGKKLSAGNLIGKDVVVWPENSEEGKKRARSFCNELKREGVARVYMVNNNQLMSKLPDGWGLKDKLPKGLTEKHLERGLYKNEEGLLFDNVVAKAKLKGASLEEQLKTKNVIYHFSERTSEEFNKQLNSCDGCEAKEKLFWKRQKETLSLLNGQASIRKEISKSPNLVMKNDLLEKLSYQALLFKAKHGKLPTTGQLDLMKNTIEGFEKNVAQLKGKENGYAKGLVVERACDLALNGKSFQKEDYIKAAHATEQEIKGYQEKEALHNELMQVQERNYEKSPDLSRGLDIG